VVALFRPNLNGFNRPTNIRFGPEVCRLRNSHRLKLIAHSKNLTRAVPKVEVEIAELSERSTHDLRLAWRRLHRTDPPLGLSRCAWVGSPGLHPRPLPRVTHTHALFADQSHSIPDNLKALLSHSRAWNCSAETARAAPQSSGERLHSNANQTRTHAFYPSLHDPKPTVRPYLRMAAAGTDCRPSRIPS